VALGLDVLGDGMLDQDPRLVVDRLAPSHAGDQLQPLEPLGALLALGGAGLGRLVGEAGIGDQLAEHHRHRLQRLDLERVIGAGLGMLDGEDSDRPLAADDRHSGEAMEQLLAGLAPIGEFGMARRLGEVEDRHVPGDRSDQPLAERELGDVDGALVEPDRGEQLEHPVAQQVDRADLALHRLGDDLDDLVELGLGARPRGHHVVQPGQYLAG
jgi:hypothetical protein